MVAGLGIGSVHDRRRNPIDGDPRRYRVTVNARQLSLAPAGNVRLGATVVFPLDFAGRFDIPLLEPMPGQPAANLVGGVDRPVQLGLQQA